MSCAAAPRHAQSQTAPESAPQSLHATAARKGILYGATPELELSRTDPEFQDLFLRHCKLMAPILSWGSVSKAPGEYDFRWQPSLDIARQHQIKITGGHLLWWLDTPKYFEASHDAKAASKLIVDHIKTMCERFAGQVWSWNVVNEAIDPRQGRPDGLRKTVFLDKLDVGFFDLAFHTAREADPNALLVYNDTVMETGSDHDAARRAALLSLLDSFLKRKIPIDAIGLQTHLRLDRFRFDPGIYRRFLAEIAARGVKILITEMDVFDLSAPSDIGQRDQAVADCYQRILDIALDQKALIAFLTWGLSDRYTWLTPKYSKDNARPDGLPSRPLPFDEQFQPKPAYWTILKALQSAPPR